MIQKPAMVALKSDSARGQKTNTKINSSDLILLHQAITQEQEKQRTLTEATHSSDVVCGKCNEGGVERLVLLVVVQDLRLTAREKGHRSARPSTAAAPPSTPMCPMAGARQGDSSGDTTLVSPGLSPPAAATSWHQRLCPHRNCKEILCCQCFSSTAPTGQALPAPLHARGSLTFKLF